MLLLSVLTGLTVAAATGSLLVQTEDAEGNQVSDAKIILYTSDWEVVETKFTGANGQVIWSDIESGTYYLEMYKDGRFWASGEVEITSGRQNTVTLHRVEPRVTQIEITDEGDGDGTYDVGEPINISPKVTNDNNVARTVRVTIDIDMNGDGEPDASVQRGPLEINGRDTAWYGYDFVPETGGSARVRVTTEINIGGDWGPTDQTEWRTMFTVESTAETTEPETTAPPVTTDTPTTPADSDEEDSTGGDTPAPAAQMTIRGWVEANLMLGMIVVAGAGLVAIGVWRFWRPALQEQNERQPPY